MKHSSSRLEGIVGKLNRRGLACSIFLLCLTAAIASPAQTLTTVHTFEGKDGDNPSAKLFQATNGNLYGTTVWGGANGKGTVFKITLRGKLTRLYSFAGTDGANGLFQATNGNFYGTTDWEGKNYGTVFTITPSGKVTTLHRFALGDGAGPNGLVQAADVTLYGTTNCGGDGYYDVGQGTVFKITPSGNLTVLYEFCTQGNCTDGVGPSGLVQTNGNFYGTTSGGGKNGFGTVFKITPSGKLTTLYTFADADGAYPYGGLVQASDGNLYGTTYRGGPSAVGTVFRLSLSAPEREGFEVTTPPGGVTP